MPSQFYQGLRFSRRDMRDVCFSSALRGICTLFGEAAPTCFVSWERGLVYTMSYYMDLTKPNMSSSMRKMQRFKFIPRMRIVRAFALHWYILVLNNSVSGQWRPWSDCADAQADLGLRCPLYARRRFRMAWSIWYDWKNLESSSRFEKHLLV